MRSLIAVLLSLIAVPATAQTIHQDVYEGTIGKSPIVLEVLTYNYAGKSLTAGQYFYSKYRTPITLTAGKTALNFTEIDPTCYQADCPVVATLALKRTGDALSGTWQATGKPARTPVALKRVSVRDYAVSEPLRFAIDLQAALWNEDVMASAGGNPFFKKLYDTDLVLGAETRSNGVSYRTVSHRGTKVNYIQLAKHPNLAVLNPVNARLDYHRYRYQSGALECAAMRRENDQITGFGGYEDTEIKVAYVSPALMFVEESGSTYCGGAHPNNFWALTGYDLKTGQRLDMNRLLKLYDVPPGWKDGDETPETPQFKALKAKLKPSSPWLVTGADIPECLAEDLGYDYSLSFNAKGLVFSLTGLPHVMGACMGEYYVVPYAELKTLWRPEAKAYFPGI